MLKHGAFAFVMSSPRQDVLYRMMQTLERAGFIIGHSSIYFIHAQGFAKGKNISKAIDKKEGLEREIIGYQTPHIDGAKRKKQNGFSTTMFGYNPKVGIELEDGLEPVTTPAHPDAKRLHGAYGGFQPKPSIEIIIVAMKPLSEKTFIEQARKNSKGVTWLDNTRIPVREGESPASKIEKHGKKKFPTWEGKEDWTQTDYYPDKRGRFPSNVLVSDNILGSFSRFFDLDLWFQERIKKLPPEIQQTFPAMIVSKPSKAERESGLKHPARPTKRPSGVAYQGDTGAHHDTDINLHPTQKPLKLFSYLITLGSREGDIILDPYIGSGTTAVAAKMLKRKWIGCDINQDWVDMAIYRTKLVPAYKNLRKLFKKKRGD